MNHWSSSISSCCKVTEGLKQAERPKRTVGALQAYAKSTAEYQETLDAVSERLQQLNDEKAELIHELSQKNRSVQEAEVAIADCRAEQEKYQKSAKEIIEELRSQYVEAMQEQATVGNELKYLERQYQQESAKNQTAVTKQTELSTAIKRKSDSRRNR